MEHRLLISFHEKHRDETVKWYKKYVETKNLFKKQMLSEEAEKKINPTVVFLKL